MSNNNNILKHLAIILDGNGRWAKARNLPVSAGHKAGAETLGEIVKLLRKEYSYIECLTVYAFSKENWGRSEEEVSYLMKLFDTYLTHFLEKFKDENIKIKFLGNFSRINESLKKKMIEIEEKTKNNNEFTFNICLSYSGREEIIDATKSIINDVLNKKITIEQVDEQLFKNYLYNPDAPYPDLIIRTGGDVRLSNFLLWEAAYSEFYSTKVFWPDFDQKALDEAIENFNGRKRNYGKRNS